MVQNITIGLYFNRMDSYIIQETALHPVLPMLEIIFFRKRITVFHQIMKYQ